MSARRALPLVAVAALALGFFAGLAASRARPTHHRGNWAVNFRQPVKVLVMPPGGTAPAGEWQPYSVTTEDGQQMIGEPAGADRVAVWFNGGSLVVHAARVTPP